MLGSLVVVGHSHAPAMLRDLPVVAAAWLAIDRCEQSVERGFWWRIRRNVQFNHNVNVVLVLGNTGRDGGASGEAAARIALDHLAVERTFVSVGVLTERVEILDSLFVLRLGELDTPSDVQELARHLRR